MHQRCRQSRQGWPNQLASRTRQKSIYNHQGLAELYEAERGYMYEAEKNSFKKIAVPAPTRRKHHYESKQDL